MDHVPLGRHAGLYMRLDTPKGRGVFTDKFIPAGTVIETCPVLILSEQDAATTTDTILNSYTYNWPSPTGSRLQTQAIVLGLGSMFNHSVREQNVGWSRSLVNQTLTYTALRDIDGGEELCINYGKVWFKDTDDMSDSEEETAEEMLGRIATEGI